MAGLFTDGLTINIILLLLSITMRSMGQSSDATVQMKLGNLTGEEIEQDGIPVQRFLGIPYAKPPVDDLRLKKPVAFGDMGDRNVTAYGSPCSQVSPFTGSVIGSEDCLTLNIFKPKSATSSNPVAVMIWIHGGGNSFGTSSDFPGENLAAKGNVILVTINYRLGVLGFLVSKDSGIPANLGLWDQHLAIVWVKDNIRQFGGNEDKITLFGESAGASNIVYQMFSPQNTANLFQRVIAQSPGTTYMAVVNRDLDAADKEVTAILECPSGSQLRPCLMNMTTAQLLTKTYGRTSATAYADGDFLPAELGYALVNFTRDSSSEQIDEQHVSKFYDYDLLTGWNMDEGTVFVDLLLSLGTLGDGLSYEALKSAVGMRLGYLADDETALNSLIQFYLSDTGTWLSEGEGQAMRNLEAYTKIQGDISFKLPTLKWLQIHSKSATTSTYGYEFEYQGSGNLTKTWGTKFEWLQKGSQYTYIHAFVFGNKLPGGDAAAQAEQQALSEFLRTAWTDFAKTGNPGADFQTFDYPQSQTYVKINADSKQLSNYPLQAEDRLWYSLQYAALYNKNSGEIDGIEEDNSSCGEVKEDGNGGHLQELSYTMITVPVVYQLLAVLYPFRHM